MIHALLCAGTYSFAPAERPAILSALQKVRPSDGGFPGKNALLDRVTAAIAAFRQETDEIIRSALDRNEAVLAAPAELLCVNIYDARFYKGYITSRSFLQYRDETGAKTIYGNYVIRMANETAISRVYKWK